MKRMIERSWRRAVNRRRTPGRPVLESLEDRVLPTVTATASFTAAMVQSPPTIVLPPGPAFSGQTAPSPQRDAVFFNALMSLGGGRREALSHFPESGGISERHLDNEQVRGLLDPGSPSGEEIDGEVFGGDPGSIGGSLMYAHDTTAVLTQMAEALAAAE